jgi:cyclic pyranopterin phosphate synthase
MLCFAKRGIGDGPGRKRPGLLVLGKERDDLQGQPLFSTEGLAFLMAGCDMDTRCERGAPNLVDRFGRCIRYLRISVTDRCNLRCVYCLPASGVRWIPREQILRDEEIAAVVRAGLRLGIRRARLTGGEPLLREGIVELVRLLAALPGLEDLSLTTNGVLLADQAQPLRAAGLRRVNISLDTLRPDRFRQITRFGQIGDVRRGIASALEAGLDPVKLNTVVVRGVNDDEVAALAALTWSLPVEVRFIELMPVGEYFSREKLVPAAEILAAVERLGALSPAASGAGCGPARAFRLPQARGTIGVISAVTQSFCASCNRLRLTAAGLLRPCLDDEQAVDLKPALRPRIDEEGLAARIRAAVDAKPARHTMAERDSGALRACMAGVGG